MSGKYLDFGEGSGRYLPRKIQVGTQVVPGF
jgi:hypothetical protein